MKNVFILGIFLCQVWAISSQTITISDEISLNNQRQFFILGKYDDRYLMFSESDEAWSLFAFDEQMHEKNKREIEPDRRRAEVLAVMAGKQDFTVIYQFTYKGSFIIKANKYNPNGQLTDSLTLRNFGLSLTRPELHVINSENQQQILIWNRERDSLYQVMRLDIPKMTLLPNIIVQTPEPEYEACFEFLIDNEATAYLVSEQHPYNSEREQHHFLINAYATNGSVFQTKLGMQNKLTHEIKFVCDNTNKCLTGVGLYSDQNPAFAKGYFLTQIRPFGTAQPSLFFNEFDTNFATNFSGKKYSEKGITDLSISQVMLRRDGGAIILLEQYRELTNAKSVSVQEHNIRLDYYYENVAAVSIHPDGKPHFQTAMFKKQYSYDDEGLYSSFFLQRTPSQARILFNDEIRAETTVSEYSLDAEGAAKRRTLFSTDEYDVFLSFRNATQTAATEVIVPSMYRSRLRLVRING